MDEILGSVGQMASGVTGQAFELEPSRLRLFLDWLVSHSSLVCGSESIQLETYDREQVEAKLKAWFEALPVDGLAWEYKLLVGEIAWWRDLDPTSYALHPQGAGK
jgi:hypothetical protein